MRTRLLPALLAVSALLTWPALGAVDPGGGGTTPPPNTLVSSRFLPLRAPLTGYTNASVALRFTVVQPSPSQTIDTSVTLYQENQTVQVRNGWFNASIGSASPGGIDPSFFAGRTNVVVTWALVATPTTLLGSQPVAIAAHAHGFAPGAVAAVTSATPTLEVSNTRAEAVLGTTQSMSKSAGTFTQENDNGTGAAVSATTNGVGGRAVRGYTTDLNGAGVGVEGHAASPSGAGGVFINTGGGDLISGVNASSQAFRVDNLGNVYQAGVQVPRQGPQGPKGLKGHQGEQGNKGGVGPVGATRSFAVAALRTNCIGVCPGALHLIFAKQGPCQATSDTGTVSWASEDGFCCICAE
ncbi:hypothetical protein JGU66_34870 [Myxococcaceae bacterium JPH2]|nr:hypothetical protein [Myxococcaceae bacterium JPH2]